MQTDLTPDDLARLRALATEASASAALRRSEMPARALMAWSDFIAACDPQTILSLLGMIEAMKADAARWRLVVSRSACDSKHGHGLQLGGNRLCAEMLFQFWCSPGRLNELVDSAIKETP